MKMERKRVIFDGFPRTTSQAEALDTLLAGKNTSITLMVALDVPHEELVKRLLNRGKESGRADDQNVEVIENRIRVYHRKPHR
jgi:adenylate kinase